ncbi:MAG TPA: nucleotide-binding protein [Iamia sp.]|nr:nucleotide-binding protein [Iamia sp.]
MRREIYFPGVWFPSEVIQACAATLDSLRTPTSSLPDEAPLRYERLSIDLLHEGLQLDGFDVWRERYDREVLGAALTVVLPAVGRYASERPDRVVVELDYTLDGGPAGTVVAVTAETEATVERVLALFRATTGPLPIQPTSAAVRVSSPVVFVGHGPDPAWRELTDHLRDHHGYAVQTFESGSRAGHTVRDVLDGLLTTSSFALLVMAGDDLTAEGDLRARQNVIHEIGLFQGRLGWNRAVVVCEEGIELFSNIDGVQQIRHRAGSIRECFGDVVAVLRREFGMPSG